jgi:hypothetical protein
MTLVFQMLVSSLMISRLDYCNADFTSKSVQSVMNAAARTVADLRRNDHINLSLAGLHWVRAPERLMFKVAMLVFQCLHGTAPRHLARQSRQVADMPSRRRIRSSSTRRQDVPLTRLTTVGHRSLPVAAASAWNSLPDDITAAQTLD